MVTRLQRALPMFETSPLIFASCRDCPSYLASAETVRDLLLPAETTVHEKWLPAETNYSCNSLLSGYTYSSNQISSPSVIVRVPPPHTHTQTVHPQTVHSWSYTWWSGVPHLSPSSNPPTNTVPYWPDTLFPPPHTHTHTPHSTNTPATSPTPSTNTQSPILKYWEYTLGVWCGVNVTII